ncbi:stage V sporulation protein AE [Clostridium gasigenes]|uniref:Stage V sporulation protein AE n=1 Tax=Clostridium gasigenes TaxID=94869 RepID=A0A1H0TW20_9CLOT|nr:stage V sporulation protein AE [Clostridium gasigenes]MBB6624277.1 stage V sporulation protein AE [Clostridium gasigenes]MBB6714665.1 stage V sporulation protein AE [Clostridium gasigenes]MBU3089268.1 stage V sporulation protein AE [Clostridium gasigenes]MBU3109396.1 stage V sporulation protein AE [Clostridium gasigenes]MBU3132093.1 stage V sporulation protein AE [Clostridium gasigenes]
MEFFYAFVIGGAICVIGQILMDTTKLTPARILVLFVTMGVALGAFGLYDKVIEIGGSGATIPLIGFGNSLAKGAIKAVNENGLVGAFTGGITATAGGITAAIVFGYLMAVIFTPKTKS